MAARVHKMDPAEVKSGGKRPRMGFSLNSSGLAWRARAKEQKVARERVNRPSSSASPGPILQRSNSLLLHGGLLKTGALWLFALLSGTALLGWSLSSAQPTFLGWVLQLLAAPLLMVFGGTAFLLPFCLFHLGNGIRNNHLSGASLVGWTFTFCFLLTLLGSDWLAAAGQAFPKGPGGFLGIWLAALSAWALPPLMWAGAALFFLRTGWILEAAAEQVPAAPEASRSSWRESLASRIGARFGTSEAEEVRPQKRTRLSFLKRSPEGQDLDTVPRRTIDLSQTFSITGIASLAFAPALGLGQMVASVFRWGWREVSLLVQELVLVFRTDSDLTDASLLGFEEESA